MSSSPFFIYLLTLILYTNENNQVSNTNIHGFEYGMLAVSVDVQRNQQLSTVLSSDDIQHVFNSIISNS